MAGRSPMDLRNLQRRFPWGDNKADFVALLKQYVQYCGELLKISARDDVEQTHTQSLLSTYSRLYALFKQIQDIASDKIN